MADFRLRRAGQPAGRLVEVPEELVPRATNLLRGGGFEVDPLGDGAAPAAVEQEEAAELIRLEECTQAKPRPCEVATAVAYARDLSEEEGVSAPALAAIIERGGYRSEEEVLEALREAAGNAPAGELRTELQAVTVMVFPEELDRLPPEQAEAVRRELGPAPDGTAP